MKRLFIVLFFGFIFAGKSYPYIDPGSQSYLFQVIASMVFGLLYTVKIYWRKIKVFLTGEKADLADKNRKY